MLAALIALTLAATSSFDASGRFVEIEHSDASIRVLDESRSVRTGSIVRVRVLTALKEERPHEKGMIRVFEHGAEFDCAKRVQRLRSGKTVNARFEVLQDHDYGEKAWEPFGEGTAAETIFERACENRALPELGGDFRAIAESYWGLRSAI